MADSVQSVVIGFGHRARSGKDTVAKMILEDRGYVPDVPPTYRVQQSRYDIRIYNFAGELKREVNENALKSGGMRQLFYDGLRQEGFGFMQENGNILALPDWVQYEENPPMDDPMCPLGKQRTLLQWWGTEFRRSINPDYWVNRVAKRIAEEKPEVALITDVRFPNEVAFCQKYGSAVEVFRPAIQLSGAAGLHPSETALDNFMNWDCVILNDSDLTTLRERALFSFDMLMSAVPSTRPTSV